jgi:hypothetical protein
MREWITITDIGGGNPVNVRTSGVSAGRSLNTSSTASVEVLARDLMDLGMVRPKGLWFFWSDQDWGDFNGVITDAQSNGDDTVEIAVEDWRSLFNKRRLPRADVSSVGYAGSLALLAISRCQHDDYLWINNLEADEGGDPVELGWDGGSLREALDGLASASGQDYVIDPTTRDFQWCFQCGTNLSGSVELSLGRHITGYTLPDSLDPVVNDLLAVPSNEVYAVTQALAVFDDDSIARYGRLQGSRDFTVGVTESALRPVATAELARLTQLGAAIEMEVINRDSCWSWFREGDTISILLPNINSRLVARVTARSINTDSQVMRVSCGVTDWTVYS